MKHKAIAKIRVPGHWTGMDMFERQLYVANTLRALAEFIEDSNMDVSQQSRRDINGNTVAITVKG